MRHYPASYLTTPSRLDVVKPLPSPQSALNELMLALIRRSQFVRAGIENEMEWERRFATLEHR